MNDLFKQAGMELPEFLGKELEEAAAERAAKLAAQAEADVPHVDSELVEEAAE